MVSLTDLTASPLSPTSTIIVLPNLLQVWPWPRSINPHYDECRGELAAWSESFKAFNTEGQQAFNKCNLSLLAAMAFPLLDAEGYRIAGHLMNLFFIIDDHTDLSDNETARIQADIIMDAIRNPCKERPEGEYERGDDGHNLVTIVRHQLGMDIQNAMDYVGKMHDDLTKEFLEEWKNIPTFGEPLDHEVRTYCYGLANWVRANNQWSFETFRHFGNKGLEIQINRRIEIRK